MKTSRIVLLGASALLAGAVVAGGVNLATAATGDGEGARGQGYGFFGHTHTEITGAERTEVVDAVEAKYDDVTVSKVLQDPDGSYDVLGTQTVDGGDQPVVVEVSEDLGTVELRTGGPGGMVGRGFGGPGGPGGLHDHTPVTGAERTKVVDAVEEKYDDVTVVMVVKDEDGSYDAMGTQRVDGADRPVRLEVSEDLQTIELRTGGPGTGGMGRGGHHGFGGGYGAETTST